MIAGFLVDLHRCTGCNACVLACRLEYGWPSTAPWRRVIPLNEARYPAGPTFFLSVGCHHCERPACVKACPSAAYVQRPDGIVAHEADRCVGCRYCEMACPFGAPRFDDTRGLITKCEFCRDRVDAGQSPACISACPTGALQALAEPAGGDRLPALGSGLSDGTEATTTLPGFADPAHCKPRIRFKRPRGIRGARLREFITAVRPQDRRPGR